MVLNPFLKLDSWSPGAGFNPINHIIKPNKGKSKHKKRFNTFLKKKRFNPVLGSIPLLPWNTLLKSAQYLVYSRRKYYCYDKNAKSFLVPFENGIFSIAPHLVIALPTLRKQKLSLIISLLCSWLLFCIALPIATAIVVALLRYYAFMRKMTVILSLSP